MTDAAPPAEPDNGVREEIPVSEGMYRAVVEQASDAFLVMENGVLIDCNSSAELMFGYPRTQLLGRCVSEFSPATQPDGRESQAVSDEYGRRARAGELLRFEWEHCRSGGGRFIAEVTLRRLAEGTPVRTVAVARDISERKRIESDLRDKSLILQTLLDNFPGGVSVVDAGLRFVAWNQQVLHLCDLPEELFAGPAPTLSALYRYNILRGEYGDVDLETHLRMLTERAQRFERHTYERTRPDGAILEIQGVPIANGGFVTTYSDITGRRHIEQQFRRQTLLLEAVLEDMPQGLSVFDENLNLQLWNKGFIEVLNYPVEAIVKGVSFEHLLRIMAERGEYGPGDREQQIASRLALARKFEAHRFERPRPNGRAHLVQGKPLYFEGKLAGFITTYTDITDRKQAEVALHEVNESLERRVEERSAELRDTREFLARSEKLAAMGALVAGVAHELNTPIGNSLLIASSLRDSGSTISSKMEQGNVRRSDLILFLEEIQEATGLVVRSLNNAADLVNSFKQVAVDQASSRRRVFNLSLVCHDVIATLAIKIRQSGHAIELDIPPGVELDSYPGAFGQIVTNFINNSILHGFDQRLDGRMRLCARQPSPLRIQIEFGDDGAGIDEATQKKIFDPYFTTKAGQGGSGLGLNIVSGIVTSLLGGQISVRSAPGLGTTFMLDLPLVAPAPSHPG